MIVFPNAKINLGLQITERLPNGYHSINTCLYPIPITDALEVIPSKRTIFESSGIEIPGNSKDNLVLKAYKLLKRDYPLPELTIHLLKNIPMGAGLGGGSSDGAFMLSLLNEAFQLFLDDSILEYYAEQLGSDCPFFIQNTPAIGTGTGTELSPIKLSLSGYYLQLIKPEIHVSTQSAYAGVVPKKAPLNIEELLLSKDFDLWKESLVNDFEDSVFNQHPSLKSLKESLYLSGALYAAMSGSGSTIFGVFEKKPEPIDSSAFSFQEIIPL
ncbi:4-(cytidine 5'-diphospho)-2-C-methyl-D-erythritol kinase [Roseivirga sp.]|uniref:4-(cytidine 5'-diphospho)-2-C-methyl-D-erythritol kinase n=1 Tax=Roseivirga sp. TaxID=1964215 RepID=UPI003B8E46B0